MSVIVYNPYSLPGFEPGTSGFVVWTTRPAGCLYMYLQIKTLFTKDIYVKYISMFLSVL
jgi:hypothetical protein